MTIGIKRFGDRAIENAGKPKSLEIKKGVKIAIVEDEEAYAKGLLKVLSLPNKKFEIAQVDWVNPADFPRTENVPPELLSKLSQYDLLLLDDSLHGRGVQDFYKGHQIAEKLPSDIKVISTTGGEAVYGHDNFGGKGGFPIFKDKDDEWWQGNPARNYLMEKIDIALRDQINERSHRISLLSLDEQKEYWSLIKKTRENAKKIFIPQNLGTEPLAQLEAFIAQERLLVSSKEDVHGAQAEISKDKSRLVELEQKALKLHKEQEDKQSEPQKA